MFANHLNRTTLLVAAIVLGMTSPAFAKRGEPKPVKPLSLNGVEYSVAHEQVQKNKEPVGMRAFVVAHDEKSGKELWKVQVYEVTYDLNLETDIQDVYIISLTATDKGLLAENEKMKKYLIDVQQHTVQEGDQK